MLTRESSLSPVALALLLACGGGGGGGSGGTTGPSGVTGTSGPSGTTGTTGTTGTSGGSAFDWPEFRRDASGTSSAPGPFATTAHVSTLPSVTVGHAVYGQVVAVDGIGYATTADVGTVTAFDLTTGATRWSVTLDGPTHADCDGRDRHPGIWGSAAVLAGVVYVGAPDGALHALDANTGAERWRAQIARPSPDGELLAGSVTVSAATGRAYVGVAGTAMCTAVVGKIAAVDLSSHTVTTATLPPAGMRGAGVWASISVDEAAGVIFAATGNSGTTSADVPLSLSVVSLDARTLAVRDHWQNPTSLADGDFGGSPLLYEAPTWASSEVLWPDASGNVRRYQVGP